METMSLIHVVIFLIMTWGSLVVVNRRFAGTYFPQISVGESKI
jgi:hypothetical protein